MRVSTGEAENTALLLLKQVRPSNRTESKQLVVVGGRAGEQAADSELKGAVLLTGDAGADRGGTAVGLGREVGGRKLAVQT